MLNNSKLWNVVITSAVSTNVLGQSNFFVSIVELFNGLWTIIYNNFEKSGRNGMIWMEQFLSAFYKTMAMKDDVNLSKDWEIDKIHLDEVYEVEAWCHMFGISMGDLKRAVDKVGTSALKVKEYLVQQSRKSRNTSR